LTDGGTRGHRYLEFGPIVVAYDERVLQPRRWTLAQSQWAVELAAGSPPGPILELCAGAGHIGLAAAVLSGRSLVQVDIDEVACRFARANAERAGRADVEVRNAPLPVALEADERFPLVVADPPYVPTSATDRFPEDPPLAIDGGGSGLDLVQQCLEVAAPHLAPGGHLLLQVRGLPQAATVQNLVVGAPSRRMCGSRSWGPTQAVVHLADRSPVDHPSEWPGG
jgi:release factor glutamine methyltransferase